MANKKAMQNFNDTVEKYLISIGAVKKVRRMGGGYTGFTYQVNTNVGTMDVTCHQAEASKVFSVFIIFDDHEKAIAEIRSDIGQTGKWNCHYHSTADAIQMLKYKVSRATEKEAIPY